MTEPDPIPVGLEQLLAYSRKRTMRELNENRARVRALNASLKEDQRQATQADIRRKAHAGVIAREQAVRHLADLVSAELGKRVA